MPEQTVHVAVYDTMADWEVGYAIAHINNDVWQQQPGRYGIATVGATCDPITTMGGVTIVPDLILAGLDPTESSMLILAGSDLYMQGRLDIWASAAGDFLAAGIPVAAICGATFALATSGLLDDRAHTSNAAEFLGFSGYEGSGHYVDQPAVTAGDLITASGTAPVDFAYEILAKLETYQPDILESWYKLYGRNDPAGYYELMEVDGS